MKKFNPERELNKIQHGNRNKIILFVISLLVVGVIDYSFALYQVRYSKRIIYTKVAPFSSKDLNLAVYIGGDKKTSFPLDTSNLVYTGINCDKKEVKASWDYNEWNLDIKSEIPNKCDIYFETRYRDASGANPPELYQGLIPVTIDEATGKIEVADLSQKWYDYDNHEWANAVLVITDKYNELVDENGKLKSDAKGKTLTLSNNDGTNADGDILQMYVWIPRYRYQLFNTQDRGVGLQNVNIVFEGTNTRKSNGQNNGEWLTHQAFTFDDTELPGIWVGKFEPSEKAKTTTGTINQANSAITDMTILPNKVSIVNKNVSTMFQATRDIETNSIYNLNSAEVDTHMMKNMEWGAVVYLSQSIYGIFDKTEDGTISCYLDNALTLQNCRVYNNNITHGNSNNWDGTITGCGGTSADAALSTNQTSCSSGRTWDKEGKKASTTGNLYGIYDMAGGMWDYVMGNMADNTGAFYSSEAGFVATVTKDGEVKNPDQKYYDSYGYSTSETTHYRGHLGDATREILQTYGNTSGAWNSDFADFPSSTPSWFVRGGHANHVSHAGVFAFARDIGGALSHDSFRVVLTQQDGSS